MFFNEGHVTSTVQPTRNTEYTRFFFVYVNDRGIGTLKKIGIMIKFSQYTCLHGKNLYTYII
jgi:hypothetical protein